MAIVDPGRAVAQRLSRIVRWSAGHATGVIAIVLMTVLTFLTIPLFYFRRGVRYTPVPVTETRRVGAPAAPCRPAAAADREGASKSDSRL